MPPSPSGAAVTAGPGLVHLQTFMAVYRHDSLSAAAVELDVSQPAVSQRLQVLEAAVGLLFERHPRGVRPRDRAHRLASDVGPAIDTLEAMLAAHVATYAEEAIEAADVGAPGTPSGPGGQASR